MKPIGMTRMKRLLEENGLLVTNIRNIRVNGVLRGCDGFATGKAHCVYFTTEPVLNLMDWNNGKSMMYRIVKDDKDSCKTADGRMSINRWCSPDDLVKEITALANGGIEY